MRKKLLRLVLGICALAAFTSCGGEKAGGTGELATVYVTASGPAGPLDSDVTTWLDATTGAATPNACAVGSAPSTNPDSVDYTVASTVYTPPNTGSTTSITPSPVVISRVVVTLTPADTATPVLPPRFQTQYLSASAPAIAPGGALSVPIRIVDNDLKSFFTDETLLGTKAITCSTPQYYTYWATVSFEMKEVSTNRVSTVTAPGDLKVNFSDFIDK